MSTATMDTDTLDDALEKTPSKRQYSGKNFEGLPDGKHVFTILFGELKEMKSGVIYEIKLAAGHGDAVMEGKKDYWLVGKEGLDEKRMNELKADLKSIGCDVDEWTRANNRPFTAELKKVGKALIGVKIDGAKKVNLSGGKEYTNVYINARALTDDHPTDGKPAVIDAKVIEEANAGGDEPF